jgi:hypothetical protein
LFKSRNNKRVKSFCPTGKQHSDFFSFGWWENKNIIQAQQLPPERNEREQNGSSRKRFLLRGFVGKQKNQQKNQGVDEFHHFIVPLVFKSIHHNHRKNE